MTMFQNPNTKKTHLLNYSKNICNYRLYSILKNIINVIVMTFPKIEINHINNMTIISLILLRRVNKKVVALKLLDYFHHCVMFHICA